MYGEPSLYEYAEVIKKANEAISTDGFKCSHNNTGWLGYNIKTPNGKRYQLVKRNHLIGKGYVLCESSDKPFQTGRNLGLHFDSLQLCKEYLMKNESLGDI